MVYLAVNTTAAISWLYLWLSCVFSQRTFRSTTYLYILFSLSRKRSNKINGGAFHATEQMWNGFYSLIIFGKLARKRSRSKIIPEESLSRDFGWQQLSNNLKHVCDIVITSGKWLLGLYTSKMSWKPFERVIIRQRVLFVASIPYKVPIIKILTAVSYFKKFA